MDAIPAREPSIEFGGLRFYPKSRLLYRDDVEITLGSRAFDILTMLIERPGELVTKDDLCRRVWPDTFVAEGNLRMQVSYLRRLIGDGRNGHRMILTIPGRGYMFVAPLVSHCETGGAAPIPLALGGLADLADLGQGWNVPMERNSTIERLSKLLDNQSLVAILVLGGPGKAPNQLAAVEDMVDQHRHGVCFVDLAPLQAG